MTQFVDGVPDVVECKVATFLFYAGEDIRAPAAGKFFHCGYVKIPVMEEVFQFGHVFDEEPAILANAVAAQG